MEFLDSVKERVEFKCVITDHTSVKETLSSIGKEAESIPGVPKVIHVNKKYGTFKILTKLPEDSIVVLLGRVKKGRWEEQEMKEVESRIVIEFNVNYFTYTEILQKIIGKEKAPSSYETIGDIIHLNLTEEQMPYKKLIGEVIHYKTGCTVINKTGNINNTYRNYELEVLCGDGNLVTVHNENGVRIFLDLERVYWCSRLQTERGRLLSNLKPGESLCDPFCGAGPHVLPALKKNLKVYANDLNPSAIECLKKSLNLNKLNCDMVCCMDAGLFIEQLIGRQIDHFVFNLPEYSLDYVRLLVNFKKFVLHCFFFNKDAEDPVEVIFKRTGFRVSPDHLRHVRKVSPSKSVLKLEINSEELFSRDLSEKK